MNDLIPQGARIRAARPGPGYVLGLGLVAFLVATLPLIYLAIVAAVAAALFWHVASNAPSLSGRFVTTAIAYVVGIFIGSGLLLFLVKPIVASGRSRSSALRLREHDAPELFRLVSELCRVLDASPPTAIFVTVDANASAGPDLDRDGWTAPGRGLALGLPLVGGLSRAQLAGIIAHELGHFRQRAAHGVKGAIGAILGWFERAVDQRDVWDERVEALMDHREGWTRGAAHLLAAGIWLTRRILSGLLRVGRLAVLHLMRRAEFDADRLQVELVGSAVFASTKRRLVELSAAESRTMDDFDALRATRRLPDDIPALTLLHDRDAPEDRNAQVDAELAAAPTSRFDTHPALRDRLAAAARLAREPLLRDDRPARDLLADFDAVSRRTTARWYEHILGEGIREFETVPHDRADVERAGVVAEIDATRRYFRGLVFVDLPWDIDAEPSAAEPEPERAALILRALRERLLGLGRESLLDRRRRDVLAKRAIALAGIGAALRAGVPVEVEEANLPGYRPDRVDELEERVARARRALEGRVAGIHRDNVRRLGLALDLLAAAPDPLEVEDGERLRARCARIRPLLAPLTAQDDRILTVRSALWAYTTLLERRPRRGRDPDIEQEIRPAESALRDALTTWSDTFEEFAYPFEHGGRGVTLARWLVPEIPGRHDPAGLVAAAGLAVDRLEIARVLCVLALAEAAEKVESALGLPPLEAVAHLDDEEERRCEAYEADVVPVEERRQAARGALAGQATPGRAPRPLGQRGGSVGGARRARFRGRRTLTVAGIPVSSIVLGGLVLFALFAGATRLGERERREPEVEAFVGAWNTRDDAGLIRASRIAVGPTGSEALFARIAARGWTSRRPTITRTRPEQNAQEVRTYLHETDAGALRSTWLPDGERAWRLARLDLDVHEPVRAPRHTAEMLVAAWRAGEPSALGRFFSAADAEARDQFVDVLSRLYPDGRLGPIRGWEIALVETGRARLDLALPRAAVEIDYVFERDRWHIAAVRLAP